MLSRKDFIIKSLRLASLTVIVSTTGYLLLREESDEKCNLDFVCGNCSRFDKCELPEAVDKKTEDRSRKTEVGSQDLNQRN
ncbi:MAG: hypothetical protein HQ521_19290 [Bacteroidetes bacterium]|nr:hypothetical protein [Bacteroidota bacterium]